MDEQLYKVSANTKKLAEHGYWPARAAVCMAEGWYSKAVEICLENLPHYPHLVSGYVIYALALYLAGQTESATEQFYDVLARDPDNITALKYLGDIKFMAGDEITAIANYHRVFDIDPYCQGLKCAIVLKNRETTRSITINRGEESIDLQKKQPLRSIPFYTETVADLYLAQGHTRLAEEIYDYLNRNGANPRLRYKLTQTRNKIKEKE